MNAWRREAAACLLALALSAGGPAVAADRWIVQGLADAELFKTDADSWLLSRNEGDTARVGRLRLWTAGEFMPGLQGYARAGIEGGSGTDEGTDSTWELAFLRFTAPGRTRLVVEGGRIGTPVGDFSTRYLSSVNPLVGTPGAYQMVYPDGIKIHGWVGPVDYGVAYVDRPLVGMTYQPYPGRAWRPALFCGVTPITGFRIGAYATRGPFLSPDEEQYLPAGESWQDYRQEVAGVETQFSRGYFELHGEVARSRYDAPGSAEPARGVAWYVEPKYTFTPRLFAALRFEANDYQAIYRFFGANWMVVDLAVHDAEAGFGVRIAEGALVKVSYRRESWDVDESLRQYYPDGYAVAAQLSWSFDVLSMVSRPR